MPKYTVKPGLTTSRRYVFGEPGARERDVIRLGRSAEAGALVEVFFDVSGEFVVGIFGKRGSGKSYSLGSLLESMCTQDEETDIGRCSRTRAVLLFDTLNIFWTTAEPYKIDEEATFKEELRKLTQWGIKPSATNVEVYVPSGFETPTTPKHYMSLSIPPSALAVDDWAELLETDVYSDRIGQLLFDVYQKVSAEGWDSEEGPQPAKDGFSVQDMLQCLRADLEIAAYYSQETIRALGQRLKAVGSLSFLQGSALPLSSMLKPGTLSIVLLNRLPDSLRSILVSVYMRRILGERSEASELQKQLKLSRSLDDQERFAIQERLRSLIPPTIVAIDEAQNVLPSEHATKATKTIIKYVREGRNHGLSFVFTTQQPSAIDARILAQVDTVIAHKLTIAADVRRLEDNLKTRNPDSVVVAGRSLSFGDWLRSLDLGQAVVSNTEEERNFAIDIRPRICPHGGQGVV